jgi:hypothetical protein
MSIFPTLKQWRNWSLQSKLTAIGTYAGLVSLLITFAVLSFERLTDTIADDFVIEWTRVNANYQTKYLRSYSYRSAVSEPAFVQALWDVTVINNGRYDASLIDYQINPDYGRINGEIIDAVSGDLIQLPIVIAAGHASLVRVRGYLMVPSDVAFDIARYYGDINEKVSTMQDLSALLVSLNIDIFGNKLIIGGPDSPYISNELPLRNECVNVVFRTGRGDSISTNLWWYRPNMEPLFWGRKR